MRLMTTLLDPVVMSQAPGMLMPLAAERYHWSVYLGSVGWSAG